MQPPCRGTTTEAGKFAALEKLTVDLIKWTNESILLSLIICCKDCTAGSFMHQRSKATSARMILDMSETFALCPQKLLKRYCLHPLTFSNMICRRW